MTTIDKSDLAGWLAEGYSEASGVSPVELAAAVAALVEAGGLPSVLDQGACVQYGTDNAQHATFSDPERDLAAHAAATLGAMVAEAGRAVGLTTVGMTSSAARARTLAWARLMVAMLA